MFYKLVSVLSILILSLLPINAKAVQLEKNHTQVSRYNLNGQLVGTIDSDPDGSGNLKYPATRNTYNTNGFLVKIERGQLQNWQHEGVAPKDWFGFTAYLVQEFTYDQQGRKTSIATKGRDGVTKTFEQMNYDNYNRLLCSVIRLNKEQFNSTSIDACVPTLNAYNQYDRVTKYEYDHIGQVTKVIKAFGTPIQIDYKTYDYFSGNQQGLIDSVSDANLNTTSYLYDEDHGLVSQITFPDGTTESYEYDVNGNNFQVTKRDKSIVKYTYDDNHRKVAVSYVDSANTQNVVYKYDRRGLVIEQTSGQYGNKLWIINTFNGFGELTNSVTAEGYYPTTRKREVIYSYDDNGNRESITHPDGQIFSYSYDNNDNLTNIYEGHDKSLLTITYDEKGNRKSLSRINGVNTNYTFDTINRLNNLSQDFAVNTYDVSQSFKYNSASQVIEYDINNPKFVHLTSGAIKGDYKVNNLNQYTDIGATKLSYDDKGNLTNDGLLAFSYDAENRLYSVTGSKSAELRYDPQGRLYKITSNNISTYFVYDGDKLIAEYNDSDQVNKRYLHGDSVDEPLVYYNGASVNDISRNFFHANHQGSVIATSSSQGAVNYVNKYDSYGVPGDNQGRFGYTGQVFLENLELYYYKARIYHPKLGRFLQTDPVGYEDQMNLYAYVGNDPVNMVDPTGKWSMKAHNKILSYAFSGRLPKASIAILQLGSVVHDVSSQSASEQYMHSMIGAGTGQTSADARALRNNFITSNLSTAANRDLSTKVRHAALTKAFHAITDAYSPAHTDANGNLLTYEGANKDLHTVFEGSGIEGVDGLTPELLQQMSGALNSALDYVQSGGQKNSDNGMSSGKWKICSGMGAQKGGC